LITGTSTGIGAACALDLAAAGYRVFAGVRREADGERLQRQARGDLVPMIIDVTDGETVRAAVARLATAVGSGGLAGLVNNAGIVVPGPLELLPSSELRRQLEVNVIGTHAVTQAVLPLLRIVPGRIVILSSISGLIAPPYLGAYAASKHALEAVADALRMELRPWRICVSLVEPDNVATPLWDKLDTSVTQCLSRGEPGVRQYYENEVRGARQAILSQGRTGMPTAKVVHAVRHALEARRPQARYPVGFRTRLAHWAAYHLPAGILDWFLRRAMGLR
jgi:NAD(P)-dependent dehydrogenase (short-subunit alcohol dehydrogenase family)